MSHISHTHLRQRRVEYAQGLMRREADTLLAACGDLAGRCVLVLGPVVASTMCALATSECRHAESRLPGGRIEPGQADLVVIPHVAPAALAGLVRQASLALARGGRLALRLPAPGRDTDEVRAALAGAGFSGLREFHRRGERILLADAVALQPAR